MENLPRDIALDILSRLSIEDLMHINCVCKSWRALAQNPRLPLIYHERANSRNPCLILHFDRPIENRLYSVNIGYGTDQYSTKLRRIDARLKTIMSEYEVVGSCNGLLCVFDSLYFDPFVVCNPFTGNYTELPKATQYPGQEVALGFGCHPTTMEYKVVRIVYCVHFQHGYISIIRCIKSDVQILTLGTDQWRNLGSVQWKLDPGPSEALLNGALHWVTERYNLHRQVPGIQIISFDLAEEKFREIERPSCGSLSDCNYHLVVLRECLGAVHCLADRGIEIWVMKEYNVKESWVKEYVIGTYLPSSPSQVLRMGMDSKTWKKPRLGEGANRVVCILKNGEILLEIEKGALISYDPESEEFKELVISGLPKWFHTIVHVESLC